MNRKMLFLARAVVYLLAFLIPPVLVSVMGMRAVESARYEGPHAAAVVMLSHVAMIAGMVVLMIYRFERYAYGAHGHCP